jgi:hypothetical protein
MATEKLRNAPGTPGSEAPAGPREEVVLLFGINQAWQAGQAEIPIQLTNRVIISPHVAKRLATLIENVLKEYETRFGQLG